MLNTYNAKNKITPQNLLLLLKEYHYNLMILPSIMGTLTLIVFFSVRPMWVATGFLELGRKDQNLITYNKYPFILRHEHIINTINSTDFLLNILKRPTIEKDPNLKYKYNDTLKARITSNLIIEIKVKTFSKTSALNLLSETYNELEMIQNEMIRKFQFVPPPASSAKPIGNISIQETSPPPRKPLLFAMAILIGFLINILLAHQHRLKKLG